MNIYQKVIEVRKRIPGLKKDGRNKDQGFRYTSSENTLEAIRPALDELGILIIPRITEPRVKLIEKESKNGNAQTIIFTELLLSYKIVNAEEPQDFFEVEWYGQGIDYNGEKGVGKALTYAEKYLVMKLLNIPTGDDDPDRMTGDKKTTTAPNKKSGGNGGSKPTAKFVPEHAATDPKHLAREKMADMRGWQDIPKEDEGEIVPDGISPETLKSVRDYKTLLIDKYPDAGEAFYRETRTQAGREFKAFIKHSFAEATEKQGQWAIKQFKDKLEA